VAGAERLAAPLAGAVAGRERVRAAFVGLHGPLVRRHEPVAHRERAHLVEVQRLAGHHTGTLLMSRSRNVISPSPSPVASARTRCSEALVIGRPPSPAITS